MSMQDVFTFISGLLGGSLLTITYNKTVHSKKTGDDKSKNQSSQKNNSVGGPQAGRDVKSKNK